jgi:adenosine deaminase
LPAATAAQRSLARAGDGLFECPYHGGRFDAAVLRGGTVVGHATATRAPVGLHAGVPNFGAAVYCVNDDTPAALAKNAALEIGAGANVATQDEGMAKCATTAAMKYGIAAVVVAPSSQPAGLAVRGGKITKIDPMSLAGAARQNRVISDHDRPAMTTIDFAAIARERLPSLLRRMPKAELHLHIEGSLEPELIFKLAQRNGLKLPYAGVDALRAAYAFSDLQSFLDIYYAGASVLLTEADFFDMAWAYFERAAADNVVHAEIFFDPQTHTERGVPFETMIVGLAHACGRAHAEFGISAKLIMCFLRHLSEEDAFSTLAQAMPYRHHFIGVGLDSGERGNPPQKFARVFARCREIGLHVVAHAGEEGPPAYIESALDVLQAERIDHGVRCIESPALVERLARQRVPLTVCPLSNVKLRVFDTLAEHNLGALLDAGLCATVNSDDPAYFGGYINDNFVQTFAALPGLGARQAWQLAANSFEASFADDAHKQGWLERLDAVFKAA